MTLQNYLKRIKKSLSVVVRGCPWLSVVFSLHFVVVRGLSVGCGFLLKTLCTVVRGCPWLSVATCFVCFHHTPLSVVVRGLSFPKIWWKVGCPWLSVVFLGKAWIWSCFGLRFFLKNSSFWQCRKDVRCGGSAGARGAVALQALWPGLQWRSRAFAI